MIYVVNRGSVLKIITGIIPGLVRRRYNPGSFIRERKNECILLTESKKTMYLWGVYFRFLKRPSIIRFTGTFSGSSYKWSGRTKNQVSTDIGDWK